MTYTQEKKSKISKYCYRMGKACGQRNMNKVNEYFGHLKHHVMIGGVLTETQQNVNTKISEIERIIESINTTGIPGIITEKNNLSSQNSQLNVEISAQKKQIKDLEDAIINKEKDIERIKQELDAAMDGKQSELTLQLTKHQDELQTQRNLLESQLKTAKENMNLLQQYVLEISTGLNLAGTKQKIDSDQTIGEMKDYLNSIIQTVEQRIEEIEKLKKANETSTANLASLKSESDDLAAINLQLRNKVGELEVDKSSNMEFDSGIDKKLEDLKIKVNALNELIANGTTNTSANVVAQVTSQVSGPNASSSNAAGQSTGQGEELTAEDIKEIDDLGANAKKIVSEIATQEQTLNTKITDKLSTLNLVIKAVGKLKGKTQTPEQKAQAAADQAKITEEQAKIAEAKTKVDTAEKELSAIISAIKRRDTQYVNLSRASKKEIITAARTKIDGAEQEFNSLKTSLDSLLVKPTP